MVRGCSEYAIRESPSKIKIFKNLKKNWSSPALRSRRLARRRFVGFEID